MIDGVCSLDRRKTGDDNDNHEKNILSYWCSGVTGLTGEKKVISMFLGVKMTKVLSYKYSQAKL